MKPPGKGEEVLRKGLHPSGKSGYFKGGTPVQGRVVTASIERNVQSAVHAVNSRFGVSYRDAREIVQGGNADHYSQYAAEMGFDPSEDI